MLADEKDAAQPASSGGVTRELIQTRYITAQEMRKISRAVSRMRPPIHRTSTHSLLSCLAALGLAFAAFSALDFLISAAPTGVQFPLKGVLGFVIGGGALIAILIRRSGAANARQDWFKAGNRYVVGRSGLAVNIQGVASFYPWRRVRDLHVSDNHVLLYVSDTDAVILPKAAFVEQDVAGFCTELERLWRQGNTTALPSESDQPESLQETERIVELPKQPAESTLELRQTREFTTDERREFMGLLRKQTAEGKTGRLSRALGLLWWFMAAYLAVSIFVAVQRLDLVAPDLALQLAITAIAFGVLLLGAGRVTDHINAKRQLPGRDTGSFFRIEPDGIRTGSPRSEFKGTWSGIPAIIENDKYLLVMLTETIGTFIVKSAFDGQEVAGFCAELQQRWASARQSSPAGNVS